MATYEEYGQFCQQEIVAGRLNLNTMTVEQFFEYSKEVMDRIAPFSRILIYRVYRELKESEKKDKIDKLIGKVLKEVQKEYPNAACTCVDGKIITHLDGLLSIEQATIEKEGTINVNRIS
jgi:hypothetical protein